MVDLERAAKIDEILQAAIDLQGDDRGRFLDRVCLGDIELRKAVIDMLSLERKTIEVFKNGGRQLARRKHVLEPGTRISHYDIESYIASGGMGDVYIARDEQLPRKVAIKVLPPELAKDPERSRRFEHEAYTASRLIHPNIITIHEIGRMPIDGDQVPLIVTEFVDGQTLREYLKRQDQGKIAWRQAVRIAVQIASALQAAHAAGVIHRDIKPENVMIRADGHAKVLDFGIAKSVHFDVSREGRRDPDVIATQIGCQPGTVRYMSPEQSRGEVVDGRSDIFSLGLVLYEMLTGNHPCLAPDGPNSHEILPVGECCPDLPSALQRITTRALRKNRDERYSSAGDLLQDLKNLGVDAEQRGLRHLRAESADQMLTELVLRFERDNAVRIPPASLWAICRFSELKHGKLERALIRKSAGTLLWRVGLGALAVALVSTAMAAWLSITEVWSEHVMHDGHTASVRRAVFSPDGRLLVSVGEDRKVIVWDFARRERLASFNKDHTDVITSVAFSPDGKWFATGADDKTIIVWSATTLQKETVLTGHRDWVVALAFTPDGQKLVSNARDETILWRVGTWERLVSMPVGGVEANSLIFVPGTNRILLRNSAVMWDTRTGLPTTEPADAAHSMWQSNNNAAISPDGALLVSVKGNGMVDFVDLKRLRALGEIRAHQDNGRAVAFSPDGRLLATGAENIILWDSATRRKITTIDYPSVVWCAVFSPDGHWLVTTHANGSIHVWDVLERHATTGFDEHNGAVRAVAWSFDNNRFASAGDDGSVMIWNAQTGDREMTLFGHTGRVAALAFSPDNTFLVSTEFIGTIIVWDLARHRERFRIPPVDEGKGLSVSPDGRLIATSSGVYEAALGSRRFKWARDKFDVYGSVFSADSQRVSIANAHGLEATFDVNTGAIITQSNFPSRHFHTISSSPDAKYLVTGENSGLVQLWSEESFKPLAIIGQHDSRIKSVQFSPDGRQVVSAGDDKTIALWNVNRRKLVTRIGVHSGSIYSLAFSPDGKHLLSGENDHTVRLYTRHYSLWGWSLD